MTDSNACGPELLLREIQPWICTYRCAVVSYCALKGANERRVINARIELRVAEDEAVGISADRLETDRLDLHRFILPLDAEECASMLHHLFDGELPVAEKLRLASLD